MCTAVFRVDATIGIDESKMKLLNDEQRQQLYNSTTYNLKHIVFKAAHPKCIHSMMKIK